MTFPAAPAVNDIHTEGAVRFRWTGEAWIIDGSSQVVGAEFIMGDGTTGPVVTPHGLTLGTASRLDITVNAVATGQPVEVGITNDGTNLTLTGDVAIPVNGVIVSAHVVDP